MAYIPPSTSKFDEIRGLIDDLKSDPISKPDQARVDPQKTFKFDDGCEIELYERTAIIRDHGEVIECDDEGKPVFRNDNGEAVIEYTGLATDKREERSWAKATFEPKGRSNAHFHRERVETFYVTSGQGQVILDGNSRDIKEGDFVNVPKEVIHLILNSSETEDLVVYVKCAPSWVYTDVITPADPSLCPVS